MIDSKSLERLHNSQDFLFFLNDLAETREAWIGSMHSATTETIQQISGRILAIDEVMALAKYVALKQRWDSVNR
jgi:hypothetical protein